MYEGDSLLLLLNVFMNFLNPIENSSEFSHILTSTFYRLDSTYYCGVHYVSRILVLTLS